MFLKDSELIEKFYSCFGEELKGLVEEKWDDIVTNLQGLNTNCLYKTYLQKTNVENFVTFCLFMFYLTF